MLVVASDQKVLAKPVNGGGPNPFCANAEQKAPIGLENQRVAGVLVSYGKFKYLNLIDLDWEKEMELACPVNKLGTVTVYQTRPATARSTGRARRRFWMPSNRRL